LGVPHDEAGSLFLASQPHVELPLIVETSKSELPCRAFVTPSEDSSIVLAVGSEPVDGVVLTVELNVRIEVVRTSRPEFLDSSGVLPPCHRSVNSDAYNGSTCTETQEGSDLSGRVATP